MDAEVCWYITDLCEYNYIIILYDIVYVHVDIDECLEGKHNCSKYAKCENSYGGYNCKCLVGFDGDGL